MKLLDLTGERYGRLTVIKRAPNKGRTTVWECRCDCGKVKNVRQPDLRAGRTKSCGCMRHDMLMQKNTIHGLSDTRICGIWRSMKDRCSNPNNKAYCNYGGRGIKVCDEWFNSLEKFYQWSMENGYAEDLSIDRIDNDGNYEPENCRWVDRKIQNRNKRSNHIIEYKGKEKPLCDWADEFGIGYSTILRRLDLGWTIEEALETPV